MWKILLAILLILQSTAWAGPISNSSGTGSGTGGGGVLNSSSADVTHTNSTSEVDLYSYSVPGGTLGTGQCVQQKISGTATWDGTTQVTFRLRYGSGTVSLPTTPTALTGVPFYIDVFVCGNGATNAQRAWFATYSGLTSTVRSGTGALTVDSTTSQTLSFSAQYNGATTAISITKDVAITTATSAVFPSNGANCSAGNSPLGVDTGGAVEDCFDVMTQTEANTHTSDTAAHSATAANTASRIVTRDGSGNFAAGTITAAVTGNASTATALAANGANASAGNAILGVDASGAAEGAFDVATQVELDAVTTGLAADAGAVNDVGNPVHWKQLLGVPAGFADGTDDGAGGGGTPGGSTTQLQYNNAGSFGGSANLTYDATRNSDIIAIPNDTGSTGLQVKQSGAASSGLINGVGANVTLSTVDDTTRYHLGYSNDNGGTLKEAANYLTNAGALKFDFLSAGTPSGSVTLTAPGGLSLSSGITTSGGAIDFSDTTSVRVPNDAFGIADTNDSHTGYLKLGSDLTADRTITITPGDVNRTLTLSGDATISGTNTGDQTITLTSDVTGSGTGSFATTIANDAVTFAKMQNLTSDRLVGRDTASSGDAEELTVGGGLEFTGSGGIQRSALTGDVTASAGSGSTTIANNAVTDAKVVDTITASNYLPLVGGTLTGQLVTDNLGIELEESDTNPTCAAGNYTIYADTSEGKLKKCTNGTASDLDTTNATLTLDQAFDNGKIINGANSEANAVDIGDGTVGKKTYAEGGVLIEKVYPDQDSLNTIADTFDWVLQQADGTDLLVADETTGVIATAAAASIDFSTSTATEPCRTAAGASPTTAGQCAYDSTSNTLEWGINGANKTVAMTDSNITGTAAGLSATLAVASGGTNLTAATEDNTIVGNGTTWQSKALPSCSNATTSKLLYDTSTNAFSCGTDQSGGGGSARCGLIDCTAPVNGDFAWINQNTNATVTTAAGGVVLTSTISSSVDYNYRVVTLGSAPYTYTVGFIPQLHATYNVCGLGLVDHTTGAAQAVYLITLGTGTRLVVSNFDSVTDSTTTEVSTPIDFPFIPPSEIFFRVVVDGSNNRTWQWSATGATWITLHATTNTTHITPTRVGFFCAAINATYPAAMGVNHWTGP